MIKQGDEVDMESMLKLLKKIDADPQTVFKILNNPEAGRQLLENYRAELEKKKLTRLEFPQAKKQEVQEVKKQEVQQSPIESEWDEEMLTQQIKCESCSFKVGLYMYEEHFKECVEGLAQLPCEKCSDLIYCQFMDDHLQFCGIFSKIQKLEVQEEIECSVCTFGIGLNEPRQDLLCLHSFHKDCLQDWQKKQNTCPNCRATIKLK